MEPKLKLVLPLLLSLSFTLFVSASAIAKPQSPNPSVSFIKSSCRATRYPNLCFECLVAYANKIRRNEHRLAQAALSVSLARAKSTTVFVAKLTRVRGLKRREYLAVKDCIENLSDGVDRLAQSVREMSRMGGALGRDDFLWHVNNVQTWVSAALTDENTCLDGFGGRAMNRAVKAAIRRRVVNVARVTSNGLALVNRFAARHRASDEHN